MKRKHSVLWDTINGVVGIYAGLKKNKGSEEGYVTVMYFPYNTFTGKPKEYPMAIPREWLHSIKTIDNGQPGIPDEIVLLYNGEPNSLINAITIKNDSRIKALSAKLKEKEMVIATLQQDSRASSSSVAKKLAQAKELVKPKKEETDTSKMTALQKRRMGLRDI